MKGILIIISIFGFLGVIVFLAVVTPDEKGAPPAVNHNSHITYTVGEKIKANPYGDWLDGEVVAVTFEDEYIVKYCGNIGWFNSWKCEQDSLKRSEMAKTTNTKKEEI